jgi:hypothetical protein
LTTDVKTSEKRAVPKQRAGRSRQGEESGWLLWIAVFVCIWLCGPGASPAWASGHVQVLVRDSEPDESRFLERIQGQLSDLDVEILALRAPSASSGVLGDAPPMQGAKEAVVVVWFEVPRPDLDRLMVYVADAKRGQTLVRQLGSDAPAKHGPSSATLEAGALVVREAVRIFIDRASFADLPDVMDAPPPDSQPPPEVLAGAREPSAPPTRAMPPMQETTPLATAARPARRVSQSPIGPVRSSRTTPISRSRSAPRAAGWKMGAGWDIILDGLATHHAPLLTGGIAWGGLELGLTGEYGLPVEPSTQYGSLRFQRYVACFSVGAEQRLGHALTLAAHLRLGGLGYRRSTPAGGGISPVEARLRGSPLIGGEARLGWLTGRGAIWLGAAGGVDAMPRTVRFGYEVHGEFQPELTPGLFQPRAALGVEYRLR